MTERTWMLLVTGVVILTAVVFQVSGELVALEENLENLEDERTVWEDERESHKIREKHLKQQLDDFGSQLKASESATYEVFFGECSSHQAMPPRLDPQQDVEPVVRIKASESATNEGNANSKDYSVLINEFKTQAVLRDNSSIIGIAKLNEDIFVITSCSNAIERFDSATLFIQDTLWLTQYENMLDLQSCSRSRSLFVINTESCGKRFISNVDPYNVRIISSWAVDSCIIRISVTEDCHVLATCPCENSIVEYSATGHLIQEIVLKPETDIVDPRLALKMANGNVLVSYDGKDDVGDVGVAIVDSAGDVLKSYSDPLKTSEIVIAMAIDGQGNVLVAEMFSGLVLLLSPDLEYERDIVSEEHGTRIIQTMLHDEVNGRLFVADSIFNDEDDYFENGRVLVLYLK